MSERAKFLSVHPIGETDVSALPVKDVGAAIGYYSQVLGFSLVRREGRRAELRRDSTKIGLHRNDVDPDNASCYFEVDDVDALRNELEGRGIEPTPIQESRDGSKTSRIFFAKEPYGVCFCFGSTLVE